MNESGEQRTFLGVVIGGSMARGIDVRLDRDMPLEKIALGQHVVIDGQAMRFFGVVTDMLLQFSDNSLRDFPPRTSDPLISAIVANTSAYSIIQVLPMLTIDSTLTLIGDPLPAKTIPPHFSNVYLASEQDIHLVFGSEDKENFWIGNPLDMESKICLNLNEFSKRSNGVFGKSGTGKTFLTRLLLTGIMQKSSAVNLVFDMQSEYGWQGYREEGGWVKGLKQLFPSEVAVFSLDEEHCRRRGISPDYLVRVGYNQIEPEDIELLIETLNLSSVAADAAYTLASHFGHRTWLKSFLDLDSGSLRDLSKELNVNDRALSTLHNRMRRLQRFHFITENESEGAVDEILAYLDRGINVILEFGRYQNELAAYILVANLLTRRIHSRYSTRKEEAMGDPAKEPRPLVITIEEAHRFLNAGIANQTIFGTIAREMRKYNVTLLVIDQRPSGIDDEVMSQMGTKLVCLLDNERDIDAVFSGVAGSRELRSVLSKLNSKQQALIFGHSVPMPIVVRVRDFGTQESYRSLGFQNSIALAEQAERDAKDIFGSH